jgi:hypothetical protein
MKQPPKPTTVQPVAPVATPPPPRAVNPFQKQADSSLSAGTVAIEAERAIAEAQGKLVIAKRFPRDEARAFSQVMESCKRAGLAKEAIYGFNRGGALVTGPSIRLAEELARAWGNIDYGIRELSRKDGVSEMESYAWDLQTNTVSSQKFTVRHIRDTKNGSYALTDERDIYEITANMAARRLRARILAVLPPDLVDAAVEECRKTEAGGNGEPLADRVRKMLRAFEKLGVSALFIEARLGHTLDTILPDEFVELTQIHNSIRDGMTKAGDWFAGAAKPKQESASAAALNESLAPKPAPPIDVATVAEPAATVPAPAPAKPNDPLFD